MNSIGEVAREAAREASGEASGEAGGEAGDVRPRFQRSRSVKLGRQDSPGLETLAESPLEFLDEAGIGKAAWEGDQLIT